MSITAHTKIVNTDPLEAGDLIDETFFDYCLLGAISNVTGGV